MTNHKLNIHVRSGLSFFLILLFAGFFAKAQITFQKVPVISMPQTPQELARGDFNNDGQIDLVSCNFNGFANQQVTLLLNSGTGTFSGANKRNFASRRNAIDVAVGDFNEDGNLDVITISQETTDALSLLLGDGTGNLAAPIYFNAGDAPQGIAVGDMNRDNNLDVLVTNRGTSNDVYIFLGNGAGGFSAPTIIAITNVWDIAVADFNGDSNPDFAVSVNAPSFSANVDIRFGNGTGIVYTAGPVITGFSGTEDIIAANLDDDTDMDIVAGSGYTINDGTGAFSARIAITQTGNEYAVADVNNDTHPDIIANDHNQNGGNARIYLGNGVGTFTYLAKFEVNVLFNGVEVADVNNDSFLDIVGIGGNSTTSADVLLGDGTGYFSNAIKKYLTPTDPRDLVKGDFNEDGQIDVAVCHSLGSIATIYLGQGNGKFVKTATNYATGSFPTQIITIDYNKDNHIDLVTYNQSGSSVTVLTGAGNGTFSLLANLPVTSATTGRMATADFNNDSNPDLVVSGYTSRVISYLSGTGSGFNSAVTVPTSADVIEIKAGDFNSDGKVDLVADLSNLNTLTLFLGNGTGGFTENSTQYPHGGSFFLVEDINNDSKPDVIAFTNSSANDLFVNDGAGNFTGSAMPSSLGGFPWGYADMNGDGFKDLIVGSQNPISSQPGQVLVFRGTATGISNTLLIDHDLSGGNRLVVHDVNADGKPDVITTSFYIYEDYLGVLINTTGAVACTAPAITSLSSSMTQCIGSAFNASVAATGTAPLTYQWRKNGTSITGATSSSYSIAAVVSTDGANYSVTITNACGSITSNNVALTVSNAPSAPTITNGASCNAGAVQLNASGGTNGNYRWYAVASGGTAIAGEVNSLFTTPVLSATTTYYASIVNGTCESSRTAATATIGGIACTNQPPVINTATTSASLGGTATINLLLLTNDPDNNLDNSSLKVFSAPTSGAPAQINSGVLTIDYTGITFAGIDRVTIEVCDLTGSCVQQEFLIEVAGDITVYNGISPNGDLLNDTWIIQYIELLDETKNNKVSLYNRWGDLVWEAQNYDNKDRVFKGLNKNGNEVSSGTYFYKIEFSSGRKAETGYLSIKK